MPKGSGIPVPSDAEAGAVPKSCHWVDVTDPGTVLVVEQPEGQKCAAVGGIMALRMHVRGVLGCVVGGRVRDMVEFAKIGLPVCLLHLPFYSLLVPHCIIGISFPTLTIYPQPFPYLFHIIS